jgi:hypothetical protein
MQGHDRSNKIGQTINPKPSGGDDVRSKVPPGTMDVFDDFLNHFQELMELMELAVRGISSIRAMPKLVEAVAKAHGDPDLGEKDRAVSLKYARRLAELAQREINSDFPLLHQHMTLSAWSSLEATIREFVAQWLVRVPTARQVEKIRKIKIPLCEYDALSPEDRSYFVVDLLEREVSAPLKQGVNRFESLLQIFGLDGPVEDDTSKTLFELSNVRNNLVHRRGIADRRLIEACPWLGLKAGDRLKLNHASAKRYATACMHYIYTIMLRVGDYYGTDLRPDPPPEPDPVQ